MSTTSFGDTPFVDRHIGPNASDTERMLAAVGYESVEDLLQAAVPAAIALHDRLDLPAAGSEAEVLAELSDLANQNVRAVSMIGLGYSDTITPAVIRRNVIENPGWYTAYTPYQPEISQGRLEVLLAFQTMVEDLTGLPVAGASLLDEPTAAAEAMALAVRTGKGSRRYLVDADTHPQTLAVMHTRAVPMGIELVEFNVDGAIPDGDFAGALLSYPGTSGAVRDLSTLVAALKERGVQVAVASDLLALTMLTPPGEFGADVVVGSAQRFGVPLGFGGPHAGFMSVRSGLERQLPGRLVGVSVDAAGRPAYRLALQTREQHIRREKATSNICTAQVLLAVVAGLYAAWHGPDGLRAIAGRVHAHAATVAAGAAALGYNVVHENFFDTVLVSAPGRVTDIVEAARAVGINVRAFDNDHVGISTDEVTTNQHVEGVLSALAQVAGASAVSIADLEPAAIETARIPAALVRSSEYLTHPTFHLYRNETAMMRWLRKLAGKDLALDRTMIPLGSCTMKLNSAVEMEAITWPGFATIHPFAPLDEATGWVKLIADLEGWLAEITGYDAVSVQPNAGSQGELAGLLAIRGYHQATGGEHRDVCLIPSSAHGTNAASAAMAGMRVVVVACDDNGDVDLDDLRAKVAQHADNLAALMITYPSTHGVYEAAVREICEIVHNAGGQVYVDGANLNALVAVAQPGKFGADVSHLNLHKTFCIPHGGGGPGVGPVGVRAHLAPYLPGHPLRPEAGPVGRGYADGGVGPVSGAPWGSVGVLPIPWAYLRLMGSDGLRRATGHAVLAANYVAKRLAGAYPVLYSGADGVVAHECILDVRGITADTGVTVDDIAKRLMDYGFHAPTMSFPVAGTLMVEPTESEDLAELDRFVEAMLAIRAEINAVAAGTWPLENSPLRNAPHTVEDIAGEWDRPYSREVAALPVAGLRADKYWPPVNRIDGAFGDRNLVCSCPAPEAYADA